MLSRPLTLVSPYVIAEMMAALRTTPLNGCIVEVGVYQGGTLSYLCEHSGGRPVYAYDTFTGIPFSGEFDQHIVGDFGDTSLEMVRAAVPDAIYGVGVFPSSALPMPPIAFAHVDCDQYESIIQASGHLVPRMMSGGLMWFDDYCLPSGKKAIDEVFGSYATPTETGKIVVRF